VADIETSRRIRELIPPPGRARQAPGRRERERATPHQREEPASGRPAPDELERHVDEFA
jgi:hypothetical protein